MMTKAVRKAKTKLTPEVLTRALVDAGGFRVVNIEEAQGGRLRVTANWQGEDVVFLMRVDDVERGQLPANPRARREQVPHAERGDLYGQRLSEEEVMRRELPRYFAETWLRRQVDELGSLQKVHEVYGYPYNTLLTAAHAFDWPQTKPRKGEVKAELLAAWQAGERDKSELARRFKVARQTVYNWLVELDGEEVAAP